MRCETALPSSASGHRLQPLRDRHAKAGHGGFEPRDHWRALRGLEHDLAGRGDHLSDRVAAGVAPEAGPQAGVAAHRGTQHGDEIVHQLRRSQTDFLRHPPLIASGAPLGHSPKAGPSYLSGRFPGVCTSEGSAVALP